ncbi:hypothetical protein ACFQZ2_05480 [Streptomonospora algeriensis]|uniref:Uncharacterized protein n=1 Tax=Streptomonospora algeriensis TaxID=995084 RepID=A0ABW3BAE4_9ACTN
MATLTVQDVPLSGLAAASFTAASAGGDEVPTGNGVVLLVRNGDASTHTLTITTPGDVRGIELADPTVDVEADDIAVVPMDAIYRDPDTMRASLSMDDETSVEYAAVRIPR